MPPAGLVGGEKSMEFKKKIGPFEFTCSYSERPNDSSETAAMFERLNKAFDEFSRDMREFFNRDGRTSGK